MDQNPHPPRTAPWHLREATNWADMAADLYSEAGIDETPEETPLTFQQAQTAAAIAQVHATIGLALTQQPATAPLP